MKAAVFNTDNTGGIVDFEGDTLVNLIRETVGGPFDCVTLRQLGLTMWVHDEGKLLDQPLNPFGTILWNAEFNSTDVIVGNILITGGTDAEGNTLGLSQEFIDTVLVPSQHEIENCPSWEELQ